MSLTVFKPLSTRLAATSLLLAVGLYAKAWSQEDAVDSISSVVRQVFEDSRRAVVQVEAQDSQGIIKGTGFFIDPFGTVYTLAVISDNAESVTVVKDGKRMPAEVLASDHRSGVSLLKTEPGEAFLRPATKTLRIASPVILVGYPLDLDLSPGFGLVAGFDKRIGKFFFAATHLRVNIPVLRGQGGSPLLNLDGEVVGIVTSSVDGGSTCYALPIQAAEKIRSDVARFGEPRHGWIGVRVENMEGNPNGSKLPSRAVVSEIDPTAPAGQAGIQNGDIVLRVGSLPVACREDIIDASFFLTAGDTAEIEVLRDGKRLILEANTSVHPSAKTPEFQVGADFFPLTVPDPAP